MGAGHVSCRKIEWVFLTININIVMTAMVSPTGILLEGIKCQWNVYLYRYLPF